MNDATKLVQTAFKSLGFDPGQPDGWWGKQTQAAAVALSNSGPAKSSEWAVKTLQRGLAGLGFYTGAIDGFYSVETALALAAVVATGGMPKASFSPSREAIAPTKALLRPVSHGGVIRQGSAVIDTYCLHCGALPGDWHEGKTNEEMVAAVHAMHTKPKSKGGRGWSDTGYHAITCPDGQTFYARPMTVKGAGAIGYNSGVFHHLMIETRTITKTRHLSDYFTQETLDATRAHLAEISDRTPIKRLMGHREVAAKLCPGGPVIDREWTDRAVA